jgi:hypothetical protein
MELYGGFGSGYGDAYRDASGGHLKGGYNLYFAQLNFGKIKSKDSHLDYGLGVKAGLLHSNLTNRNYYNDFTESVPLEKYIDNSFLLEPNFFVRLGGERLKFNIKLGTCWIYKFTHTDKYLPYSYLNLGLSMNYKFGK